ncbi:MAG TPA: LuxR C-terminal-related transcriptional regulator, partial [Chitinophagaceae bacterium]|nr:LuxR C-terminal-related transcriptional regulator [Chitinophagaceae bacterium]
KSSNKEELIIGVKTVHEGKNYFCEDTSMKMAGIIARSKAIPEQKINELTQKEIEIIKLVCEQYASKEIAEMTSLAFRTVEKYRASILQKTKSKNMVGVVIYAIKHGIYVP